MKRQSSEERFRRVSEVQSFDHEDAFVPDDWLHRFGMFLVAIPFIGTFLVLLYFLTREKRTYYVRIKEVRR